MLAYVPTYVKGLDDLLGGGIPEGNVVLVTGTPGARKTSLVYSILHSNACRGSGGLFISLEQGQSELTSAMTRLGMDELGDERLYIMDAGRIRVELENLEVDKDWVDILKRVIKESVEVNHRELVAIDPLDVLYALGTLNNPRRELFHFFSFLRDLGLTTFLISELPVGSLALSRYGEDFLADGVLLLRHYDVGETEVQLRLRCVKMRQTAHEEGYHAFGFGNGGFYVTKIISRTQRHGPPGNTELMAP
ncbi:MAG: RAD55 family ATPase [Thermoplasmata archaeon]